MFSFFEPKSLLEASHRLAANYLLNAILCQINTHYQVNMIVQKK